MPTAAGAWWPLYQNWGERCCSPEIRFSGAHMCGAAPVGLRDQASIRPGQKDSQCPR